MKNKEKPTQTKSAFCQGSWILLLRRQYKHSIPLTSDRWHRVEACWAMRSLGKAQKVPKPGCGVAVCQGQLRDGLRRKCCPCWGLRGERRGQHCAAEWELVIILCGVWVKQFLQTLPYSCQNKEFWCCFGLAFSGIVIEKTSIYKQSLISWKHHSSKTVRGNSQTCHL